MRKWFVGAGVLLLLLVVAAFMFGPAIVESRYNRIIATDLAPVAPQTRVLHERLRIVDLHGDTLLWDRDLLAPSGRGHVDLARMEAGNVALQLFSSVTKTPKNQNYDSNSADGDNIDLLVRAQLQPLSTWNSLLERSLYHARRLDRAVERADGRLVRIERSRDLDRLLAARARGERVTGALLTIEGLHNLEGEPVNLARLHDAGYRMAGLVHFFDNEVAGSMHGIDKGGLTPMGRRVVARMEEIGMIVDVAHLSEAAMDDLFAIARRPIVSSHGGVRAICDTNRNLSDAQIRKLAATGGILGIGLWDGALCGEDPATFARSVVHVRNLVGIEHVALGTDFDGAVATAIDASQLAQVTQALVDAGLDDEEIELVMGGNALRVLRAGIEPL